MNFFHGENRRHTYFEGWYLKHQARGRTLALIPGFGIDAAGNRQAFLQIITDEASHWLPFDFAVFQARRRPFGVRLGDNLFTERGISLHIDTPEVQLHGRLQYGTLTPLGSDIMGPFRFAPRMECRHGVLSMHHGLQGRLSFQGKTLDFDGGIGYMEMDWGTSFPSDYLWTQCVMPEEDCAVMASVARILYLGLRFQGCIAAVLYRGREIRLATYHGVKIRQYSENGLVLQQKPFCLKVEAADRTAHPLKAPARGGMSRLVRESASCPARYRLYEGERVLFDITSPCASFERMA